MTTTLNNIDKINICKTKLKLIFVTMKDDSYNTEEQVDIPEMMIVEQHLNGHFIGEGQQIYFN